MDGCGHLVPSSASKIASLALGAGQLLNPDPNAKHFNTSRWSFVGRSCSMSSPAIGKHRLQPVIGVTVTHLQVTKAGTLNNMSLWVTAILDFSLYFT